MYTTKISKRLIWPFNQIELPNKFSTGYEDYGTKEFKSNFKVKKIVIIETTMINKSLH